MPDIIIHQRRTKGHELNNTLLDEYVKITEAEACRA